MIRLVLNEGAYDVIASKLPKGSARWPMQRDHARHVDGRGGSKLYYYDDMLIINRTTIYLIATAATTSALALILRGIVPVIPHISQ
jgi:hypothetical protein